MGTTKCLRTAVVGLLLFAAMLPALGVPTLALPDDHKTIIGVVWYDDNDGGTMDLGEEPAIGVTINAYERLAKILPGTTPFRMTTQTDSRGRYALTLPVWPAPFSAVKPYYLAVSVRREPAPKRLVGPNYHAIYFLDLTRNEAQVSTSGSPWREIPPSNETTIDIGLRLGSAAPIELSDYLVPGGRFFEQTGGRLAARGYGFAVTNEDNVPFLDTWHGLGLDKIGYPASQRFTFKGFTTQVFQKAALQWQPGKGVFYLNTFDELHNGGKDLWLDVHRFIPPVEDTSPDAGLSWEQVVARHMTILDRDPALRDAYLSETRWLDLYGLPMGYKDYPSVTVVRGQRAALQQWKVDLPWAKAGDVAVANGGDIAKEANIFPLEPLSPQPPPRQSLTPPSTPS